MYFNFISQSQSLKSILCRHLVTSAIHLAFGGLFAGQVVAQNANCTIIPPCDLSFSPFQHLLLGESFNITCSIIGGYLEGCNTLEIEYNERQLRLPVEFDKLFGNPNQYSELNSINGSSTTIAYIAGHLTENNYFDNFHNAMWKGVTTTNRPDPDSLISLENHLTLTTKVQRLLPGIPLPSIQFHIVQIFEIIFSPPLLLDDQKYIESEGSYRAIVRISWLHSESLQSADGTYFNREYVIKGTTTEGAEDELARTSSNSVEFTLTSKHADQNLTITPVNLLGMVNATSTPFKPQLPEPSITWERKDDAWRVVIRIMALVNNLTIRDSQGEPIKADDLEIIKIPYYSTLTFKVANLNNTQNYTLRLDLGSAATTETSMENNFSSSRPATNAGAHSQIASELLMISTLAMIWMMQTK